KLAVAFRRKMKIPGTEKASLRTRRLRNCRRVAPRCRLPRLARSHLVKHLDEASDFPESGAGDDLMLWHNRKFARHLRHSGRLKCGKERLWNLCRRIHIVPQPKH